MTETEKTSRGFRIFARVPTHEGGSVRVQESSLAFEGAHVWLFLDGQDCTDHLGRHQKPNPHLNVAQARQLALALNEFCDSAEQGELMENAEP
jgi:hypothetical protein